MYNEIPKKTIPLSLSQTGQSGQSGQSGHSETTKYFQTTSGSRWGRIKREDGAGTAAQESPLEQDKSWVSHSNRKTAAPSIHRNVYG